MNRQPFDGMGVAKVQSNILALPATQKQHELLTLRQEPIAWIIDKFLLSDRQKAQLAELPTQLLDDIAQHVADAWAQNQLVSFQKEDSKDDDDYSYKDVLFGTNKVQQYVFGASGTTVQEIIQPTIVIRYRS